MTAVGPLSGEPLNCKNTRCFGSSGFAVVVPAFNEERAILEAVAAVPAFVDHIIVVDDASRDRTALRVASSETRAELISHPQNQGVGAAIISGYRRVLAPRDGRRCGHGR